jgi:hypothetical protein
MSTDPNGQNEPSVAGGSTYQHVSGPDEDGTFTTDRPPGYTPSGGSSNKGINERHANREDVEEELAEEIRERR